MRVDKISISLKARLGDARRGVRQPPIDDTRVVRAWTLSF